MQKRKYYIISEIRFAFLKQRHQIFAELLSDDYQVIFIERVPSRIPFNLFSRLWSAAIGAMGSSSIEKNSKQNIQIVSSKMLPHLNSIFRVINKWRARFLLRQARQGDVVHIMTNAPAFAIEAEKIGCKVVVDIIHNWWEFPYHKSTQIKNIVKTIEHADLVLSDSEHTLSKAVSVLIEKNRKPLSLFLPPGVQRTNCATDLTHKYTGTLNVVFFGNLRMNSDLDLITRLLRMPNISLTFFGLLDASLPKDFREEVAVLYRGSLSHEELFPELLKYDAVLLPYDQTGFSQTIFPAKYYETLALGKPIISNSKLTHLPFWDELIWTSNDIESLGIKELLQQHYFCRAGKQVEVALSNSWESRVLQLKEFVNAT